MPFWGAEQDNRRKKMSGYTTEIAGICGLFCGTCPSYPEKCEGCLSGRVADHCVECRPGFRACAKEKGVTWCFECGDFPCPRLEAFIPVHVENGVVHHENVITDLQLMREVGVQQWVDKQAKDNTCPDCGKLILWPESKTHKCSNE